MVEYHTQAPTVTPPPSRVCDTPIFSISWRAIIAGTIAGLSLQLLLTILGVAIGLVVVQGGIGWGMAVGTGIWLVLTSCISLFAGGLIAGFTGRSSCSFDGLLQGFLQWSLVTGLTALLLVDIVGGALRGAGAVATGVGQAAGQVVGETASAVGETASNLIANADLSDLPWQELEGGVKRAIEAYAPSAIEGRDGKGQVDVIQLIRVFLADEDQAAREVRRQRLRQSLRQELDLTEEETNQLIGQVEALYERMDQRVRRAWHQARDQAVEVAQTAASAGAHAAWWLFFCLLLGAACGSVGGLLGAHALRRERTIG